MASGTHPYTRAAPTGKTVAIVGAGPAGLACAHRLAMYGHDVTLFEANSKAGGLNEFGIAAYKTPEDFAQAELNWLLSIGGISVETGKRLGADLSLDGLQSDFDAVFLSIGLNGVNALTLDGDHPGAIDAVDWIAKMRQSTDKTDVPVGKDVVVIGGGMMAVDAAVQAKLLGADTVTIAYRKAKENMSASQFEQDLATSKGVRILYNATPKALAADGITFTRTGSDETITLRADQVMRAIGQALDDAPASVALEGGKIKVDSRGRTSVAGVWAGGDCASGGEDLTVTAVAEGRDAAEDIHASLTA